MDSSYSPQTAGSIPACAGEAHRHHAAVNLGKVYPRVCGGSAVINLDAVVYFGLSPRVRGKRLRPPFRVDRPRSIPACAGEATRPVHASGWSPVYPRVCGGSSTTACHDCGKEGLSPRVRGKPLGGPYISGRLRSIPACAGEASAWMTIAWTAAVYPRVCGGSRCAASTTGISRGLSPRVRGKPQPPSASSAGPRSIPACAGEAPANQQTRRRCGVYPRVCGGSEFGVSTSSVLRGLSPRVRGKRR